MRLDHLLSRERARVEIPELTPKVDRDYGAKGSAKKAETRETRPSRKAPNEAKIGPEEKRAIELAGKAARPSQVWGEPIQDKSLSERTCIVFRDRERGELGSGEREAVETQDRIAAREESARKRRNPDPVHKGV